MNTLREMRYGFKKTDAVLTCSLYNKEATRDGNFLPAVK